ncbi:MAG: hypothetical protein ACRDMZ_19535 [Solirubrobacteraceae bacterium]
MSTTVPSSRGTALRVERLSARLARLDRLVMMRVFLGAFFIAVFFENLSFIRYTPGGYERLVERYAARTRAPDFWADGVMGFFADHSEIFSKLQAVTEMGFGLALVIGFASAYVGLAAAGFLLMLWISQLGIFWVWELPGLIVVALVVGLGNLSYALHGPRRERLLGPRSARSWPLWKRLALAPVGALALAALIAAAGTGGDKNGAVTLRSALVFGAALIALALADNIRPGPGEDGLRDEMLARSPATTGPV